MTTTSAPASAASVRFQYRTATCAAIFDFGGTLAIKEAEESDVGGERKKGKKAGKKQSNVTRDEFHVRDKVFGGRKRVAMIRKFLKALTEIGVSCVVLSYSKASIIKKLLGATEVEIDKYFEFVVGQDDIPYGSKWNKADGVSTIMMELGITSASRVLFFDDSKENARDVMKRMPLCCVHWVNHNGLRESHFHAVRLWGELLNKKSISFTEEEKEAMKRVKEILSWRVGDSGDLEMLVSWHGQSDKDTTWESIQQLTKDYPTMMLDYLKQHAASHPPLLEFYMLLTGAFPSG